MTADQRKLQGLIDEAIACEKEMDGYKALFEAAQVRADSVATKAAEGNLQDALTRWMEAKSATWAVVRRMR